MIRSWIQLFQLLYTVSAFTSMDIAMHLTAKVLYMEYNFGSCINGCFRYQLQLANFSFSFSSRAILQVLVVDIFLQKTYRLWKSNFLSVIGSPEKSIDFVKLDF